MEIFERKGKIFGFIGGGSDLYLTPPEMDIVRSNLASDVLERFQVNEDGAGQIGLGKSLRDFCILAAIDTLLEQNGHTTVYVNE